MPTARYIDTFIVKTVEWCNLNCTYCYYYHGQDTSYTKRPRFMSRELMATTVDRMVEHCVAAQVPEVHVTLHGGEPLLQDKEDFHYLMDRLDAADKIIGRVRTKVTTNGVMLANGWGQRLLDRGVHIGVSIDGPPEIHDKYRLDLSGRGTSKRVEKGLQAALDLDAGRGMVGTITVLDPSHDGALLYQYLRGLGSRNINVIMPEQNYVNPPPDYRGRHVGHVLEEIFKAWIAEGDATIGVRLLSDMVRGLAGAPAASDQFGTSPVRVAVIETDGSMEPTDNFRACAEGMSNLGLSVDDNGFEDLVNHPFFELCLNENPAPPSECSGCKFIDVCSGGRITTRYSATEGFSKKSVHCASLYHAFSAIEETMKAQGVVASTSER